jgi:hypothetical protein
MLNTLHTWCKKWRVLINSSKSKCIHIRKGRRTRSDFSFHIGNNTLETVSEYKYLCVIFSENTDYIPHCQTLSKSAGRALGGVINNIHSKGIGFKSFEELFCNCVVPVLDYCSSVWGYKEYQTLDSVQKRAVRYF